MRKRGRQEGRKENKNWEKKFTKSNRPQIVRVFVDYMDLFQMITSIQQTKKTNEADHTAQLKEGLTLTLNLHH